MNVRQQFRAEFWPNSQKPLACSVAREDDGRVRFSSSIGSATGLLFIRTENSRHYGLGEFSVSDRIAQRPRMLALQEQNTDSENMLSSNIVDSAATRRLNSLLQKTPDIRLELKIPSGSIELRTLPLSIGSASSFFMVNLSGPLPEAIENIPAVLFLFGMHYVFRVHIVDQTDTQAVISLPNSYCRVTRRATLREGMELKLRHISSEFSRDITATDLSYSGTCVIDKNLKKYEIWSELELELNGNSDTKVRTHALVVEQSEKGTHLLFCGGSGNIKDRFRLIHGLLNEGTELVEDPELVWKCLQEYDYLELLDAGKLERVKKDCLEIWNSNIDSNLSLLPVLKAGGRNVGTYGIFQGGIDQWFHHLLAIDFSPKSLAHAATLYQVWPNYLSSRFEHSWVTAWYNPAKTWHNRFCQVFLKEHEKNHECITFDRHWFWLSQLASLNIPNTIESSFVMQKIEDSSPEVRSASLEQLRKWYPKLDSAAVLPKSCRDSTEYSSDKSILHREFNYCILRDGKLVGNLLMFYTTQDLNPFSLTNSAHINIFDPNIKNSLELINVIKMTIGLMKDLGFHRAAFTLDFDAPIQLVKDAGFTYFAVQRCISFTTRLLPDWLSNSALSFADLTGRVVC